MIKWKSSGVYRMYINGKLEELCISDDGWKQLYTFRTIEQYTKKHKITISFNTMPTKDKITQKITQQDVLSATSQKYEIVACKTHLPNATNILFAPRYRIQIHDKETNQTQSYVGTLANFIFDLLNNLRGKQK